MGNQCVGARESLSEKKEQAGRLYGRVAKATRKKYSYARLKFKGYKFNYSTDDSETQKITAMENSFPLISVAIDEFEQRLQDFYFREKTNKMTIQQVVDTFKDNLFLDDIEDETSITRKMLTHKVLQNTKNIIYLPYLRLLGILYCSATPLLKAQTFYNVIKPKELDSKESEDKKATDVAKAEVLIPEYFEKMLDISYTMMIVLFSTSENGEDKRNWIIDELEDIFPLIYEQFQADVFGGEEKLTQEVFVAQFEKDNSKYLVPANLRRMVFSQVVDIVFSKTSPKKKTTPDDD